MSSLKRQKFLGCWSRQDTLGLEIQSEQLNKLFFPKIFMGHKMRYICINDIMLLAALGGASPPESWDMNQMKSNKMLTEAAILPLVNGVSACSMGQLKLGSVRTVQNAKP